MPVRIYDIAKKLGIESKAVIAKAKELGISTARVPSSTLDKITAEYLEEQMGWKAAPPPAAEPAPTAPAPAVETPAAPAPEVTPAVAAAPAAAAPVPEVHLAAAPAESASEVAIPAPPELAPAVTTADHAAPTATIPEPAAPVALAVPPTPEPPLVAPTPVPVPPPAPPTAVEAPAPPVPVSPPAPPPPPPVPAVPPPPKIGDKVGFINLGTPRTRTPERPAPVVKPPPGRPAPGRPTPGGRSEPPRGRDGRGTFPGARGAASGRPSGPFTPPARGARAGAAAADLPTGEEITLRPPIIVRELAEKMGRKPFQVIADLMELGIFATVNQSIESDIAQRVAAKHNFRFKVEKREKGGGVHAPLKKEEPVDPEDRPEDLLPRAPVVTIMGHVDHGKTTLLDVIRKANVAADEAGGITQHIGAYTIAVPHPERPGEMQQITFLDTPGHAAFSAMRARGANVTDIVILVVAANDGVMPQTLEALSHAQAAKVPIIVAVNKCDHPSANPMMVRQQLQDKGVVPDDWGGDNIFVDCSALTKQGVDKLLAAIVVQADLLELKANPTRLAKGNVVESGIEPGGPVATVLVRKGTLRVGNIIICGVNIGRVRALISEDGTRMKEAGPSQAVRVLGLDGVPVAGIEFTVVENEKEARVIAAERIEAAKAENRLNEGAKGPRASLETLLQGNKGESAKVLRAVVKADTQGSVEAIVEALKKIETDKVTLEILHSGVGTITETDVVLASASNGIILGFHTRVDNSAAESAKREGVQIKLYAIIYELIDQVKDAMAGLLDPILKEAVFGSAEVRKVFALSKGGNVAGCVVASGRLVRGKARVVRRRNTIYEGLITTLRRFQDEVNEVRAGMECGIRLDGFDEFEAGDLVECYTMEKVAQKL